MYRFLIVFLVITITGCVSNDATVDNHSQSLGVVTDNKDNTLFSELFGLLTPEQARRFQKNAIESKGAISVWPVFEQNSGKLGSIYDPNFITSSFQFTKPARLKYQQLIDYQISEYSDTKLDYEVSADLHFYTLFSTSENDDGSVTVEYIAGASDWQSAKTMKNIPELEAIINTTIWSAMVREVVPENAVKTLSKFDEEKLAKAMMRMSVEAMKHFLVVVPS